MVMVEVDAAVIEDIGTGVDARETNKQTDKWIMGSSDRQMGRVMIRTE